MDAQLAMIIVGSYFILMGLFQILRSKVYEKYAIERGVLNANLTVKASSLVLIGAGVCVMIEDIQIYAMYALCGFLVLAGFILHKFWDEKDPKEQLLEVLHFAKNIGLAILLYVMTVMLSEI